MTGVVGTSASARSDERSEATFADWVELTKPRITLLIVITGAAGMLAAAEGMPPAIAAVATLVGLALSSGGASALNHVWDRDIDRRMTRTARRPVAAGRISARAGTIFGIVLLLAGTAVVAAGANMLAAALTFAGGAFYVLGYTMVLKRNTVQNIVIGGAAGAVPPMAGWAAVTGDVGILAVLMFAIVFFWTPPHFWALAVMIRDDYERVGVPMLPVVATPQRTAASITRYSFAVAIVSAVPVLLGELGLVYAIAAALLGARIVMLSLRLQRVAIGPGATWEAMRAPARDLFLFSMSYLALLCGALLVDRLLGG